MMGQMKQLMELQQKMKKKQDELRNIHIESEVDGVTVIINGEMEVIETRFAKEAPTDQKKLAEVVTKAVNKGLTKAKEVAATNMQDIMGDMGLGGMLGGKNPMLNS